jgi:hypothetical protein
MISVKATAPISVRAPLADGTFRERMTHPQMSHEANRITGNSTSTAQTGAISSNIPSRLVRSMPDMNATPNTQAAYSPPASTAIIGFSGGSAMPGSNHPQKSSDSARRCLI